MDKLHSVKISEPYLTMLRGIRKDKRIPIIVSIETALDAVYGKPKKQSKKATT